MARKKILLAEGALSWSGHERRSNRYGSVTFWDTNSENEKLEGVEVKINLEALRELSSKRGRLTALIKETRKSTHIGDLFRGFLPETPNKGDRIKLGSGLLFHKEEKFISIGLKPLDGRSHDWLDPEQLYRCHEQTVRLFFEYNE